MTQTEGVPLKQCRGAAANVSGGREVWQEVQLNDLCRQEAERVMLVSKIRQEFVIRSGSR